MPASYCFDLLNTYTTSFQDKLYLAIAVDFFSIKGILIKITFMKIYQ